jgi:hypothetical protein
MTAQTLSIPAVVNELFVAHFAMTDNLHRAHGDALDALGLGPRECPFQLISFGAALAFTRVWRSGSCALGAHGASTNQMTVHLGPHSFHKRCALLPALWFPCLSARMDPAKLRPIGRPGRIWWPGYRHVRGSDFEASERSAAIPHRALTGWYARGDLWCLGAPVG